MPVIRRSGDARCRRHGAPILADVSACDRDRRRGRVDDDIDSRLPRCRFDFNALASPDSQLILLTGRRIRPFHANFQHAALDASSSRDSAITFAGFAISARRYADDVAAA